MTARQSDSSGKRCVFCDIVQGHAPSYVVYQGESVVVFLDHRPLAHGHSLVIPRAHHATFLDVPAPLRDSLFAVVQALAWAMEKALGADGSFVAINTKVSQSVPHVHVHVVPRWRGDGLFSRKVLWLRRPYPDEETPARIQAALAGALREFCMEA